MSVHGWADEPSEVTHAKRANPECSFSQERSVSILFRRGIHADTSQADQSVRQESSRWFMKCPGEGQKLIFERSTGDPPGLQGKESIHREELEAAIARGLGDFIESLGGNGSILPPPPFRKQDGALQGAPRVLGGPPPRRNPTLAEKEPGSGVYI
jgi:hypothetical protein